MLRVPPTLRRLLIPAGLLVALGLIAGGRALVTGAVAARIRHEAAGRDLSAAWRRLDLGFPLDLRVLDLTLTSAAGDTAFRAESLRVEVSPMSLLRLRPRPRTVSLAHARVRMRAARCADPDTLPPDEPRVPGGSERAERQRRAARRLVETMLSPVRGLPRLELRDVEIRAAGGSEGPPGGARLAWLEMRPTAKAARLSAGGVLMLERPIPFELTCEYGNDDRIEGGARFLIPPVGDGDPEPLRAALDGRLEQDRRSGSLRLADSTRVSIGSLPFLLSGALEREGPRVRFALAADGITARRVVESLPAAVLGPLVDLAVKGSFDYRLSLDLDLARPDSVRFEADVIPHGLALDPARTRLGLFGLEQPFTADIHLPRGVRVARRLSPENPGFRALEEIDSLLVHAVLTNEDGGFFRHRGFNVDAVRMAIAANLKAGAFRRGAGTVTMQLARNLYLGHQRTLSRKAQEVVLAWILEHLTGVSKRRLLEIYLNIIEWGPGVHGAEEAARYYFGHDAGRVSVSEALFLSTVVPAPRKWRYRFDPDGELRSFARAQMHFIGRAMIAKGRLAPESLPAVDSLRIELRGPARDLLFPPDSTTARKPAPAGAPA